MRTPTLQYLYLQKPLTLILIIAGLALLPWLAVDSYKLLTFDESHTIIAYFEALAFIGYSFVFMGRRLKLPEAFTASLVLITAFATQSYFFCNAVEMLYSLSFLIAIVALFKWEESNWTRFPWAGMLMLSLTVLIKGGFTLFLAVFIFGIYIILSGHSVKELVKRTLLAGVLSAIIPAAVFFLSTPDCLSFIETSKGSSEALPFYLYTLVLGFLPWVVYLLFSVFGISPSATERRRKKENRPVVEHTENERKVYLYSIIVIACTLIGFSVFPLKKGASISLLYPFASLFIARYATFLTEYRTRVTRIFGYVLLLFSALVSIGFLASSFGLIDLSQPVYKPGSLVFVAFTQLARTALASSGPLNWALFFVLLFAQCTTIYQLSKKVNIKILYSCIGLYLAIVLFFYVSFFLKL